MQLIVLSFLKVINEQNTLRIPKYGDQNLACWYLHLWSLWMAFTCCYPLSWLPIWLQSKVVDPCFIHSHIFLQNSFLLHWNSCKQCSESLTRFLFDCEQMHFEYSFLIDKYSCKMVNTLLSDIFNSSAILQNFNIRSVKTSWWSFLVFSRTNLGNGILSQHTTS